MRARLMPFIALCCLAGPLSAAGLAPHLVKDINTGFASSFELASVEATDSSGAWSYRWASSLGLLFFAAADGHSRLRVLA